MDLIDAARMLVSNPKLQSPSSKLHLLFAGSGELGAQLRANCNVIFDAERTTTGSYLPTSDSKNPRASFAGFLNQTEISKAYVAADVLVLPSDYDETWGLVVNEAMASGLPCIISDHCGCTEDLGAIGANSVYECANVVSLANELIKFEQNGRRTMTASDLVKHSFGETVKTVARIYQDIVIVPS